MAICSQVRSKLRKGSETTGGVICINYVVFILPVKQNKQIEISLITRFSARHPSYS
jgi:hypothetical protein